MASDSVINGGDWYSSFSSSNIERFRYDMESETLTVEFREGRKYEYYGVPPEVVEAWIRAWSKGKYHARHIKFSFDYREV